jgi:hypothetical protein
MSREGTLRDEPPTSIHSPAYRFAKLNDFVPLGCRARLPLFIAHPPPLLMCFISNKSFQNSPVLKFSPSQRRDAGSYFNGLGIHPTGQDASNVKPQPTSPAAEACLFEGRGEAGAKPGVA